MKSHYIAYYATMAFSLFIAFGIVVLLYRDFSIYKKQISYNPITISVEEMTNALLKLGEDPGKHNYNKEVLPIPNLITYPGGPAGYIVGFCKHVNTAGFLTIQLYEENGDYTSVLFNDHTVGDSGKCRGFYHGDLKIPVDAQPGKYRLILHMNYVDFIDGVYVKKSYEFTSEWFEVLETDPQKVVE